MNSAHTILAVDDDILTLPAYYRKQFSLLGIPMLKHKVQSYTVPPVHASSAWIAHNAAMEMKRPLLGHGARPVIGRLYRPAITTTPAVELARAQKKPVIWRRCELLGCAGAVFALLVMLGNVNG